MAEDEVELEEQKVEEDLTAQPKENSVHEDTIEEPHSLPEQNDKGLEISLVIIK